VPKEPGKSPGKTGTPVLSRRAFHISYLNGGAGLCMGCGARRERGGHPPPPPTPPPPKPRPKVMSSDRSPGAGHRSTGAGACPRGRCRLAACPGDRIPRSRIRSRSRISCLICYFVTSCTARHAQLRDLGLRPEIKYQVQSPDLVSGQVLCPPVRFIRSGFVPIRQRSHVATQAIENNMGLSVVVYIQLAASGNKI
jgi:hypothetical protein